MQDYQDELLPRTALDKAVEYVEDKYGSISKAPTSAIRWIRKVGLSSQELKYGGKNSSSVKIKSNSAIKLRRIHGTLYTNSKNLIAAGKWVNKGRTVRIAAQLGGISYSQFRSIGALQKKYVYSYKRIKFKFNTYNTMFKDLKAMDWVFAPTNMKQIINHSYLGHVKKITCCKYMKYRRYLK